VRRRIYLASSWRNERQPVVVEALRHYGHQVYDFRNPSEGYENPTGVTAGFQWSEIDPNWQQWTSGQYIDALLSPIAQRGFESDYRAMQWADTGVLLMPSGRSAHLEAGYFNGARKPLHILLGDEQEPELMYLMATSISRSIAELVHWLATTGDTP
jgi:hypothetical protein